MLPHLGQGEGHPGNTATGAGAKVPQMLGGWHDLNLAVARALPTSLLHAGQLQRATLLALRRRGRVR